jgi:hypothetical protein
MGALGKRDRHHATARDTHEPADRTWAQDSRDRSHPRRGHDRRHCADQPGNDRTDPFDADGNRVPPTGPVLHGGDQLLRNSGPSPARRTGRSRTSSLTARALSRPGSIGDHVVNRSICNTASTRAPKDQRRSLAACFLPPSGTSAAFRGRRGRPDGHYWACDEDRYRILSVM